MTDAWATRRILKLELEIAHLRTTLKIANKTIQLAAERQRRDHVEASYIRENADT